MLTGKMTAAEGHSEYGESLLEFCIIEISKANDLKKPYISSKRNGTYVCYWKPCSN